MPLTSSQGLLALLRETDPIILQYALTRLVAVVDEFWCEMSSDLAVFEELFDSTDLPQTTREVAALLTSQVYFHLGEYDESVHFALSAGKQFHSASRSLYVDTILGRCIDIYVEKRESGADVDARLETLFASLAELWQADDSFAVSLRDLVGFFIRSRRIDLLEQVLKKATKNPKTATALGYTLRVTTDYVRDITFRRSILQILAKLYTTVTSDVDYMSLTECLLFLEEDEKMAGVLKQLLDENKKLIAFQIAFDLADNSNQDFIKKVSDRLTKVEEVETTVPAREGQEAQVIKSNKLVPLDTDLSNILEGQLTTSLYVKFLYARCNADIHVLNQTKKALDSANSVTHNATVVANALMYCGTTLDGFLVDNLEWLGRATNWAKFTATASIGAIHKGHSEEAMNILEPYLPDDNNVGPIPFQEAGSLYALGLVHSSSSVSARAPAVEYLRAALQKYSSNEIMVHGASLGLGLAGIGLRDESIYDALFDCVTGCDAVAGEGAAVAIGLVMLGSGDNNIVQDLLRHANENDQKEKTIRGLSMATALMMYRKENEADDVISQQLASEDPWIRLGGCFTLGLAYAGTNNTSAVQRLLGIAVKDTSDDVRRTAVMMIGLATFKSLDQCIDMTKVLSDSYNPHIRYGVAMAIGIAGCGSANKKAVDILWLLKDDPLDFVRQGAYLALAMVLMQITEADEPRVKEFRALLKKKISDKGVDTCTKYGAILAVGLLDAGGRNCTIALHKGGHVLSKAVIGIFLFSQYWFWFPYTLMISLAFQPTCIIGLNEQLEMPKYSFVSQAAPSRFQVPKTVLAEKKEAKAQAGAKAVLSITKKEQSRKSKKVAAPETPTSPTAPFPAAVKEEEPTSEILVNPARVTLRQLDVVAHNIDARYKPLKKCPYGVVMLVDANPSENAELVANIDPKAREADVKAPEPFAWP